MLGLKVELWAYSNAISGEARELYSLVALSRVDEVKLILILKSMDGTQGERPYFSSHRLQEISWHQGGHMVERCPNAFLSKYFVYIRESESLASCHSQGCERKID